MNILAIDTSTNVLAVGLVSGEKVVGEYITNIKRNHSTRVLPAIDYLLKDVGLDIKDINKVVVAMGPGSYTGLRIGVTIAKSLAWTLQVPIVGVSSLKAMAASAHYFPGYISPIMDGRRGNVFTGLYQYNGHTLEMIKEDQYLSAEEWAIQLKALDQPVLFVGNDVSIHQDTFQKIMEDQAHFPSYTLHIPRPGELALLGQNEQESDIHTFVPNYVRLAEAEAKWREKNERI